LSLIFFLDRHSNSSEEDKKKAEKMFKEIGEAYAILSDKQKRFVFFLYSIVCARMHWNFLELLSDVSNFSPQTEIAFCVALDEAVATEKSLACLFTNCKSFMTVLGDAVQLKKAVCGGHRCKQW